MASMLELGQIVQDRYRVEELLGRGGMGAVYRAYDLRLDITVAIKENLEFEEPYQTAPIGRPDAGSHHGRRSQFEREAKILARLRHPGLPNVIDHFVAPGRGQYLVMEFVHGKNLLDILTERGPFSAGDALQVTIEACRVLEYLHGQSPPIIHRDIKPANLRLTPQGRIIVVDFGIAKEGATELTQTGALGVTPGFSPMEQYAGSGQTDARSDVYALGATLYALLTDDSPPAATARALGTPVVPLTERITGVSQAVQAAVDRAMAFDPKDRFPSATAFREALERAWSIENGTHTTPAQRGGITAAIAPEGRDSDGRRRRARRRSFFEDAETDPMAASAPPATRSGSRDALEDGGRAVDEEPARAATAVAAPPTPARGDPRKIAAGLLVVVAILISAIGYAAHRSGYLPWPKASAPTWSAIELHLLPSPNTTPSASTLVERIDSRSGPVGAHTAAELLSDSTLAGQVLNGQTLASLVRDRITMECGRTYTVLASAISPAGRRTIGTASLQSEPCSGPDSDLVAGSAPNPTTDLTQDATPDQIPARTLDQTPAQTPARTPDQTPAQTPVPTTDQTAAQTPDRGRVGVATEGRAADSPAPEFRTPDGVPGEPSQSEPVHAEAAPSNSSTSAAVAIPNPVRISPSGGDFSDLVTAFDRINQDPGATGGLRIELAPGIYSMEKDLWIGKPITLIGGSDATLRGRIVMQTPRAEVIGVTIESTGKSAVNIPSGELLLQDCVIRSSTHPGIEVLGNGSLVMRSSTIRDCFSKGLLVRDNGRVTAHGGLIEGNESGIDIGGHGRLALHGTTVSRSRQSGVYLHDAGSATIDQGSVISGNESNGIFVAAGASLDLMGASVRGNERAGVVVEAGGTATLRDCDLTGNAEGPLIEDPGSRVTRQGDVRTR